MHNYLLDDPRTQRRLWFSLHVLIYCVVAFLWPIHHSLLVAHSVLLVTLSLHVYALYTRDVGNPAPELIPVKIESGELHADVEAQSFWYQWHDV